MKQSASTRGGFTLIELLVVIAIYCRTYWLAGPSGPEGTRIGKPHDMPEQPQAVESWSGKLRTSQRFSAYQQKPVDQGWSACDDASLHRTRCYFQAI